MKDSFAKIALSFNPERLDNTIQFRFKTRKKSSKLLTMSAGEAAYQLNLFVSICTTT